MPPTVCQLADGPQREQELTKSGPIAPIDSAAPDRHAIRLPARATTGWARVNGTTPAGKSPRGLGNAPRLGRPTPKSETASAMKVTEGAHWHAEGVENPFGRCVLVAGSEAFLLDRGVQAVLTAARTARPTAEVNSANAAGLSAGALAELSGGSLFATSAVAIITDLGSLPAELVEPLLALAKDPGPELALVCVHHGGQKGKTVLDRVRKAAHEIVDAAPVKTWELPQFVVAEARSAGTRLDQHTASVLVDAVGSDLGALAGAVRQLLADSPDAMITEDLIARYFEGRAEVTSFAVADDVMAGNATAALEKLRWALSTGVAPVLITSALAAALRGLGKYLDARDTRVREADLARLVGVPPWKLRDLSRQARSWSQRGIAAAIARVAQADAAVKGAEADAGFALERMVLAVAAARG